MTKEYTLEQKMEIIQKQDWDEDKKHLVMQAILLAEEEGVRPIDILNRKRKADRLKNIKEAPIRTDFSTQSISFFKKEELIQLFENEKLSCEYYHCEDDYISMCFYVLDMFGDMDINGCAAFTNYDLFFKSLSHEMAKLTEMMGEIREWGHIAKNSRDVATHFCYHGILSVFISAEPHICSIAMKEVKELMLKYPEVIIKLSILDNNKL